MPTKEEHVTKANGTATLALAMPLKSQSEVDWALIMLFYAAMHYVEAYLSMSGDHLRSHETRDKVMNRNSKLKKIYREYSDLKYYGYNARYEVCGFKASQVSGDAVRNYTAIKAYLSPLL